MLDILAQSVEIGEATAVDSADAKKAVEITLWDLATFGGWWLLPLVALLIVAIYIFVNRYQTIQKSNQDPSEFLDQLGQMVRNGEIDRAKALCETKNSPFSRMVRKGLERLGNPLPDIAAAIENEGKLEVQRLEKSVAYLATIAGAAPMLGFLGTVSGMILAFMKISYLEGNVNPSDLASGIYQAMITTAAGLIVGIPAYVGYNVLTNMVNSVIFKMEITSTEFVDLLQEPAS